MTPTGQLAVAMARAQGLPEDIGAPDEEVLDRYGDSAMRVAEALAAVVRDEVARQLAQQVGEEVHRPFDDDGALYCGWTGDGETVHGCGEAWPCEHERRRAALHG